MRLRLNFFGFVGLALASPWACEPDLASLTAGYPDVGGSGGSGASAAAGGSGATAATGGGTGADGGAGGSTGANGGSGGSGAPLAGMGGEPSSAGEAGATPVGPSSCENLERDPNESDVDCGGTSECARCETNFRCTADRDCISGFCKAKRCADPSCEDGYENQDETGTDCGGSCAPEHVCALGDGCRVNEDCESALCQRRVCASDQPDTCDDQVQNQDESATDCGGACVAEGKPCAVGAGCNGPADCETLVCTMSVCADDIVVPAEDVIDDFEDDDLKVIAEGGRVGNWYTYGDGTGVATGTVSAIPGGRGTSTRAFHATGTGFSTWGSGIGADLDNPGMTADTKVPYDASAYSGVTFWARAEGSVMVALVLPDAQTDAAGGVCTTCDHHYSAAQPVDTTWQRYTVPFANVTLESGTVPTPGPFDPSGLVSVQFRMASGVDYDLWIDDLAFVE